MEFYYLSAQWPGAVNDARVLRNSSVFDEFEAGRTPFPNAIILGDSSYPRLNWLVPNVPGAQGLLGEFYS